MRKLDERTIAMIRAIYARRNTYYFIDKAVSPDDDYYEFVEEEEEESTVRCVHIVLSTTLNCSNILFGGKCI